MQMMIRKVMRPGVWLVVFCTLGACRSGFDEQFPTGPFTTREPIFAVEYRAAPFNDDDPTLPDDMLEFWASLTPDLLSTAPRDHVTPAEKKRKKR